MLGPTTAAVALHEEEGPTALATVSVAAVAEGTNTRVSAQGGPSRCDEI